MTDLRICAVCGQTITDKAHMIFNPGGFHGFVESGRMAPSCRKCGSPVMNDRCTDETCPYSDRPQSAAYTEG